jgi:hypothetical protein
LRLTLRLRQPARALKTLKGLGWEGDLNETRQSRRAFALVVMLGRRRLKSERVAESLVVTAA